jgi:hypothetical protein
LKLQSVLALGHGHTAGEGKREDGGTDDTPGVHGVMVRETLPRCQTTAGHPTARRLAA